LKISTHGNIISQHSKTKHIIPKQKTSTASTLIKGHQFLVYSTYIPETPWQDYSEVAAMERKKALVVQTPLLTLTDPFTFSASICPNDVLTGLLSGILDPIGDTLESGLKPVGNTVGTVTKPVTDTLGSVTKPVVGGVMGAGQKAGDKAGVGAGNTSGLGVSNYERFGGKEQTAQNPLGL
jgi:hypothetical protein